MEEVVVQRGRMGRLIRPFETFFKLEAASGMLLLFAAAAAIVWANSPWGANYYHLWETPIGIGVGGAALTKSLHHWINDGLMAVFFFVVGLEIKREVLVGELAAPRKAALSVAAALGGMVVPALLYAALNAGGAGAAGWGIPMATDIAFALGVLALLGSRVPLALKVFVTAVAIVDDLGAVLVIALFYTASISLPALLAAGALLLALVVVARSGVRRLTPYALLGVALWFALLKSGVHATIGGVLVAMTIPARQKIDASEFLRRGQEVLGEFARDVLPGSTSPTPAQRAALHTLSEAAEGVEAPLARLEHGLHPLVAFFIMPLFAFANAGVTLGGDLGAMLAAPVTAGVMLGLFAGKQIGIVLSAWLAVRAGVAVLPERVGWAQLWGVSMLCGIGFTMSLFIAGLAFVDPALLDQAKVGIIVASLGSGLLGAMLLVRTSKRGGAAEDSLTI